MLVLIGGSVTSSLLRLNNYPPHSIEEAISKTLVGSLLDMPAINYNFFSVLAATLMVYFTGFPLYRGGIHANPRKRNWTALLLLTFLAEALVGIATTTGTIALILPGLFLGARLAIVPQLILFGSYGVFGAFAESWRATGRDMWPLFRLQLLQLTVLTIWCLALIFLGDPAGDGMGLLRRLETHFVFALVIILWAATSTWYYFALQSEKHAI